MNLWCSMVFPSMVGVSMSIADVGFSWEIEGLKATIKVCLSVRIRELYRHFLEKLCNHFRETSLPYTW